ncbi:MAG: MBL fold metallo-hydrolase [Pseudomonadota bacterium]
MLIALGEPTILKAHISLAAAFALATCLSACEQPVGGDALGAAEPQETTYTFYRNATAKLSYAGNTYLLDPMLSDKGTLPSFAGIAPNPTVELPVAIEEIVSDIDAVIVGHMHVDHFDPAAAAALDKSIQIITPLNKAPVDPRDPENTTMFFADQLRGYGFENVLTIGKGDGGTSISVDGVTFTQEFALHGRGVLRQLMGGVNGIVLEADGAPTVYWTGDTVLDEEGRVEAILKSYAPDIIIAHTGGAVVGAISPDPLMMDEAQAVAFITAAKDANPSVQIVAVHMGALDHCFTTKPALRAALDEAGLADGVSIPGEGDVVSF